jgi:hypothetical protein
MQWDFVPSKNQSISAAKENSNLQRIYNAMGFCPKQKPMNI